MITHRFDNLLSSFRSVRTPFIHAVTSLVLLCCVAGCAQWSVATTPTVCAPLPAVTEDYLSYVKEAPLQPHVCENGRETYRFVGYTFHLAKQVNEIRIDVADGVATLTLRRTDLVTRGTPSLVFDKSRALTSAELAEFRKAFNASGFWSMPTEPADMPCVPDEVSVLEVVRDGRYHKRDRYCDGETGARTVFAIANRLADSLGE